MRKNLFLSGSPGCGKSTALMAALGDHMTQAGGFLTLRRRDANGDPENFVLASPDGLEYGIFLDVSGSEPKWYPEIFRVHGCRLLRGSAEKSFVILDEIGGPELLIPEFQRELQMLLKSNIPCIGVVKSEYGAGKLMKKLGYTAEYDLALHTLHQQLRDDSDTDLLHCTTNCEAAFILARNWVQEYCL